MPEPAMLDYFYGDEAEQYTFYRIPKVLFTDPAYRRISSDATLEDELCAFDRDTRRMLEEYFEKLRHRRPDNYAEAFRSYRRDVDTVIDFAEAYGEEDYSADIVLPQFDYPVNISFVPSVDPKTEKPVLAEQITFESLVSFLYMDLYKGMAAGNLPRRCHRCRKWFLAVGAYNTVYCDRVVPGGNISE